MEAVQWGRPPPLSGGTGWTVMRGQGTDPGIRWAHRVGFTVGLCLLLVALNAWHVPSWRGPPLGADIVFSAAPTGELEVSPVGQFLAGTGLRPLGPGVAGTLSVTNQTGRTLDVRLRAQADVPDLDAILQVEISSKGQVLFRGQLGRLHTWTGRLLLLRSGRSQTLTFRAWVPAQVTGGLEGQVDSVTVQFLSKPVKG